MRPVNGKIASMKLTKAKTTKMRALAIELTTRLSAKADDPQKLQRLQKKMATLVTSWGIPKSTTQKCKDYAVIAKLLAYCVILTQ